MTSNGGPVFGQTGMNLRDCFAALAMLGSMEHFHQTYGTKDGWQTWNQFASMCFKVADAMLKEREK